MIRRKSKLDFFNTILSPLSKLMGFMMSLIYSGCSYIGIESVGICIVLFTVSVNVLLLPMTIKQQKFTKISRIMNPEIQKIQEKYKGKSNQDSIIKQQTEIQEIYKNYGVNPVKGIGPVFIQMPIFLCLYKVISDIPYYVPNVTNAAYDFMGLNLMETPGFHLKIALIIPLLAGFTQWMSTKIAMQDTMKSENDTMNATMNSMNIMMPLVSIFMCISLPIYMGIYWIAGSVARTLIQLLINVHMKKYSDEELINKSRRKFEKRGSKKSLLKIFYEERFSENISWQQNHSKSLSISEKANLVSKYRKEVNLKNEV